jgi:Domain of unknown function DUF29
MSKQQLDRPAVSYDADFYEWCLETAELIRQKRFDEIDAEHLAEEIGDMGKRDKREVRARLVVLLMYLLKWQVQPNHRHKPSWQRTIRVQRSQLALVLDDSPSLVQVLKEQLPAIYLEALRKAMEETGLTAASFPKSSPFAAGQVLDPDFFPSAE